MSDVTQGQTGEPAKKVRKDVSDRAFLSFANGVATVVDKMEQANGARYTLKDYDKTLGGDRDIDYDFSVDSPFKTFCAILGYGTKVGNVANTIVNDKSEPGTFLDAFNAIQEFIAAASDPTDPVWAERVGGVGAKVDLDALVEAYFEAAAATGKTPKSSKSELRAKFEKSKELVRDVRHAPEVLAAYTRRVSKAVKSMDDLMNI